MPTIPTVPIGPGVPTDEGPEAPEPEPELECEALTDFAFAQGCCEQERLIRRVKTACNDCIKKAEEVCESKETEPEQLACIEEFCVNEGLFEDIASLFPELDPFPVENAGQEFYRRCEIQEKKDACFGCLKQSFMPASYAIEVRDYIGRGFIKHPYLLIETIYSRVDASVGSVITSVIKAILSPITAIFSFLFGAPKVPDIDEYYEYYLNICVGTCPEVMHTETQCKNHSRGHEDDGVPLGLICRTFPDKSGCSACDNNTTSLLDFLPSDPDCNNSLQYGAVNPITLVTNAAFRHRSKYCRALTGHIVDQYRKCSRPQSTRTNLLIECLETCEEEYSGAEKTACEDTCQAEAAARRDERRDERERDERETIIRRQR